jgi:ABC-type spermidine/putrescine transport system permease subunit II
LFDGLTYSRIVLPEVVFALGLFVLFDRLDVEQGIVAIVIGHVVFNSAYATIIIQARVATMSASLEEAAADLGANRWRVFRRVTLPLLMPAVIVSGLLTLTFSLDNVITSQFLGGTDAQTLPVLVLGMIRQRVTPEVNAIGSGLMLMTLITFLVAGLMTLLRPTGAGGMLGLGRRAQ